MRSDTLAEIERAYAWRATDFTHADCVRFALDVIGGAVGAGASVAARHGLALDWTCERSALRAVRKFAGTLAGGLAKLVEAEGYVPVKPDAAQPGAIGMAFAPSVFGCTVCVLGAMGWQTVSGPNGLVAVDEACLLAIWGRA